MLPILTVISRAIDHRDAFGGLLQTAVALARWKANEGKSHDRIYYKWGSPPRMTEEWIEEAAGYDAVILSPGAWEGRRQVQSELIARNPGIEFGTYFSTHTCPTWMAMGREGTYVRSLWDWLSAHLAIDEHGDPAQFWNGQKWQPAWDFTDRRSRLGAINRLADYVRDCGITQVFCDYCSAPVACWSPTWPGVRADYNQNGLDHCEDPDEVELVANAWRDFVIELKSYLPQETTLIVNGTLALREDWFAACLAGHDIYLELFPDCLPNYEARIPLFHHTGVKVQIPNHDNDPDVTEICRRHDAVEALWPEGVEND